MSDKTVAHVKETGESAFAVDINVSGHDFKGDEPVDAGGKDLGPAPYDLLTAALAECTAMTIRWYAQREKWPLENVEVEVSHHKAAPASGGLKVDTFHKKITITGSALTAEQHAKLLDISSRCPIHRTLEATPVITRD